MPALLRPRRANTKPEVVHQYVETLRALKKLVQKTWVAIYASEFTAEVLIADGLYPLRPALNILFNHCGITEYDANTVAKLAEPFLLLQPSCEEVFGINDVLAEQVTLTPNISSMVASKNLASNLERCIILMAILRKCCQPPVTDHWLAVNKPIPTSSSLVEEVTVTALIHDLAYDRGEKIPGIPVPPDYLESSVSLDYQVFGEPSGVEAWAGRT